MITLGVISLLEFVGRRAYMLLLLFSVLFLMTLIVLQLCCHNTHTSIFQDRSNITDIIVSEAISRYIYTQFPYSTNQYVGI